MAFQQPQLASALPATVVNWHNITLSDIGPDPIQFPVVSFTFPAAMVADPLTSVGPAGYGPDNKAPWWPWFQARHKVSGLYWVQGHMLNDNIHGPGVPGNLVPISGALNTNMLGMVEKLVKTKVAQGKILRYVVQAHWEGAMASSGHSDPLKHPEAMRTVCGMRGDGNGGSLLWGEQFAPTRLSWEVYEYTNWVTKALTPIALSRYGHDAAQWNNNYPV